MITEQCDGSKGHFGYAECDQCDARKVIGKTLAEVENWYYQGVVNGDTFRAYKYLWKMYAYRYIDYPAEPPLSDRAKRIVDIIVDLRLGKEGK